MRSAGRCGSRRWRCRLRRTKGGRPESARFDVVHYLLTVPSPRRRADRRDPARRPAPRPAGVLRPGAASFQRLAYDRAARSAAAVHRDERVRAGRARDALDLDPGRIHVVPLAIDHTVFRGAARGARADHPLPGAGWPPHKNHTRLLQASTSLRETCPARPRPHRRRPGALEPCPRASRSSARSPRASSRRSIAARRASCTRACMRASASRRSRRWRALPGGGVERRCDPRGVRRRGRPLRSDGRRGDGRSDARGGQPSRELSALGVDRAASSRGTRPPAATRTSTALRSAQRPQVPPRRREPPRAPGGDDRRRESTPRSQPEPSRARITGTTYAATAAMTRSQRTARTIPRSPHGAPQLPEERGEHEQRRQRERTASPSSSSSSIRSRRA